jgi:hypothetical protein
MGEPISQVSLSGITLEMLNDSIPVLNIVFNRSGNYSVYGDIRIDLITKEGKSKQVAEIRGIAVYTPTSSRKIKVTLDKMAGIDYKSGTLHILYTTPPDARPAKIAEAELMLL